MFLVNIKFTDEATPAGNKEILRACASQNILNCLSVIRHGSKNMNSDDTPIVVICEG